MTCDPLIFISRQVKGHLFTGYLDTLHQIFYNHIFVAIKNLIKFTNFLSLNLVICLCWVLNSSISTDFHLDEYVN